MAEGSYSLEHVCLICVVLGKGPRYWPAHRWNETLSVTHVSMITCMDARAGLSIQL